MQGNVDQKLGDPPTDEQNLRAWIGNNFGGLREDRSTASYALEFLKTGQANLILAQQRGMAEIQFEELRRQVAYLEDTLRRLKETIANISARS